MGSDEPSSDAADGTGGLRLADLRRQMIRQACSLQVKSRVARVRGDVAAAARLAARAEQLRRSARRIRDML
jgi:hypothetical protein